ncbi:molybdenum ABC transporter ATP-binding protein [Vibrio sp. FNV 38]|nr:molybdenum ABC transporter ATP-binding protein [Vibrio sp. FNV 38]
MTLQLTCSTQLGRLNLDLDLTLQSHGVTVLFGESGCGKTTTLRTLAGLTRLSNCQVSFQGQRWQSRDNRQFLPTHKRNLGYVFQHPALFNHLDVTDNIKFGLRGSRIKGEEINRRFNDLVELLGLGHLVDRRIYGLSGGEQQRVAIARALVLQPNLLLMDEPLSALDEPRKQEVLPYLELMTHEMNLPIVYVTHSLSEVTKLADNVVVLNQGQVVRLGTIDNCLAAMSYDFDPHAVRAMFDLSIKEHTYDGLTLLANSTFQLWVSAIKEPIGKTTRCEILASDVSLSTQPNEQSSILNSVLTTITAIDVTSNKAEVLISLQMSASVIQKHNQEKLYSMVTQRSANALKLKVGCAVWASIKAVAIV